MLEELFFSIATYIQHTYKPLFPDYKGLEELNSCLLSSQLPISQRSPSTQSFKLLYLAFT